MTVPRHIQANTVRERTLTILKGTIETVSTLTADACSSTIAVYTQELEESWRAYADAYGNHEESLVGKEHLDLVTLLQTIQDQYLETRTSHIKARIKIGKLASPNGHNGTPTDFNATMNDLTLSGERVKTYKLPPIHLPVFLGDMKNWMEFKATAEQF